MFGLSMASWYFFSIIPLYLFLKCLWPDLKSLGSLQSPLTNEFAMRRVCYFCAMIRTNTEVASGVENASDN